MDCFLFDLIIFSIINCYGSTGVILDELKVNLSLSKVGVLMIMDGLAYS